MHDKIMKVFRGEALSVEMIGENDFIVDISGIIAKHNIETGENKRLSKWEETDGFKNYLRQRGISPSEGVLKSGNSVKIHNKLLINFAMWLSVDFCIFAEDLIYDLLTGKKQLELENQTKSLVAIEQKYSKQISDLKEKVNRRTQHKLITYQDNTMSLRKVVSDRFVEYDIKEKDLWKFLCDHSDRILEDRSIRTSKKVLLDNRYGKQVGDSVAFNEDIDIYIKEFIGDNAIEKMPQQGTFNF